MTLRGRVWLGAAGPVPALGRGNSVLGQVRFVAGRSSLVASRFGAWFCRRL